MHCFHWWKKKADRKFLDKALEDYRDARKGLDDLAKPSEKAIHPQYLAQQISHFAADDAIFTCDVGTPTVWAARYLKNERQASPVRFV